MKRGREIECGNLAPAFGLRRGNARSLKAGAHLRFLLVLFSIASLHAAPVEQIIRTNQPGRMITKENQVQYIAAGQSAVVAPTNQWLNFDDTLRTLEISRATVRLTDWKHVYLRDRSRLEIVRQPASTNAPMLRLLEGELYLSRGGGDVTLPVEAAGTRGTPKGTEFLVSVANGTATFTMFDGEVELANSTTPIPVPVRAGQQGIAEPGAPIRVQAMVNAKNIVQWWLYYPAVLDLDELAFAPAEQAQLAASLTAYRSGHLVRALQNYPGYPTPAAPSTDAQRTYLAALLLSVGAVDKASAQLAALANSNMPPVLALRLMIDVVQGPVGTRSTASDYSLILDPSNSGSILNSQSPSLLLALSYAHQATNNLRAALAAARSALSPSFLNGKRTGVKGENDPNAHSSSNGFAWAHVAELEFSFGHPRAAREAVERALTLSPSNAQAHCVHGFLFAADHNLRDALAAFDRAIELDPFLGNAWLGRGLVKRRMGSLGPIINRKSQIINSDWLSDLQTAAIIEPRRSLLRAYAGKSFSDARRPDLALKELDYAAQLDPNDPTPPLYKALELHQQNRPNEAIRELERSIELNNNRAVYRSRLLLDQDYATRSASLAKIYQDAGLEDVALREAARAVSHDYASHSAHQFLAESYNALRDPTRFNLRYETVWFNELLLTNLLSPVGTGLLSQNISQQEYSRLFEHNRLGLSTSTEYRSDGQFREIASHYGLVDRFAYTLDLDYQRNEGTRPNNDLDRIEWYSQFKYQFTARDSVFLLTKYQDYESGDNFQHYDPAQASRNLTFSETQTPLVAAAFHREWKPGIHTALLGSRLESEQQLYSSRGIPTLLTNSIPQDFSVLPFSDVGYGSKFEIYQLELNQILQTERNTWVVGARQQWGDFSTSDHLQGSANTTNPGYTNLANVFGQVEAPFQRSTVYGYYTLAWSPALRVTGGVSYDHVEYPGNFRFPPIGGNTEKRKKVSPKAAIVWDAESWLTFRGIYSEFLGGASLEESFRLEPTQLAGFSQAFRTVISETEAGSVAVPDYQLGGAAMDLRPGPGTYAGLHLEEINSTVKQDIGMFLQNGATSVTRSSLKEELKYRERSVGFALHQLVANHWTAGVGYRWTKSDLDFSYPGLAASGDPSRSEGATLHRFDARLIYSHPTGWFSGAEAQWFCQKSHGYPNLVHLEQRIGEKFWQVNVHAGIRLLRRRAELTASILNLTDQDYRLNSLTPFQELPRERVYAARLRLRF